MPRVGDRPKAGGAPSWMLTYSDVVTLLMTFFVLLMTFASDEPENFEQLRTAMFGSGGGRGIAGTKDEPFDRDAISWRERAMTGRLSYLGSEIPPIHSDPALEAVAKGLRSLEEETQYSLSASQSLKIPLGLIFEGDGRLSSLGVKLFHNIAANVRHLPYDLQIQVTSPRYLGNALALARHLVQAESLAAGRVGVGVRYAQTQDAVIWLGLMRAP